MSRKAVNDRVLELIEHFGTKDNSVLSVEFFFFTDSQDSASNLSIELFKLGYEIYGVHEPDSISNQWSITGCTPKMNVDGDAISDWSNKMEQLAKENNSRFDGWGTLIDPDND